MADGSTKVVLRPVTAADRAAVAALELHDSQLDVIASNAESLEEAAEDGNAQPRAIYAGEELVGFLMYDRPDADDGTATIYRFMIDKHHQGKGFGKLALAAALAEIQAEPQVRTVAICYMPHNLVAKTLYQGAGFREVGLDEDGEMIAHLPLPLPLPRSDVP